MPLLHPEVKREVASVLRSSVTGFSIGSDETSDVFEYEVHDGLYLGVAPRHGNKLIATVYVYIADATHYYAHSENLNEHPVIIDLVTDLESLFIATFDKIDLETSQFPTQFEYLDSDDVGRYYAMDLPYPSPRTEA